MSALRVTVACVLAAAAIASCTGSSGSESGTAAGIIGTWVLESVSIGGEPYELPVDVPDREVADATAWVQFTDSNHILGQGPCNDFQGRYEVQDTVLKPLDVTQEAAACSAPNVPEASIMAAERVILEPLTAAEIEVEVKDRDDSVVMVWSHGDTRIIWQGLDGEQPP